ncbi:hypothetical protein [Streptomyces sp. NPDC057695]|uniref:hypothetical protein n=1 Tax=Streptomyces sp. NPDC057695 TaxID=3346217 RepID=UPI00367A17B4
MTSTDRNAGPDRSAGPASGVEWRAVPAPGAAAPPRTPLPPLGPDITPEVTWFPLVAFW